MMAKRTDAITSKKTERRWQQAMLKVIDRQRGTPLKRILGMLSNLLMQIDYLYNNDRITDDEYAEFIAVWLDLYEEGTSRS